MTSGTQDQISMNELRDLLPRIGKDELILDVRSSEEFSAGHIPGARNIPHTEVARHLQELKGFKKVYIHCRSGGRATQAFQMLSQLGLNNLVCIGGSGMKDWLEAGYPVEAGTGA